MESNAVVWFRKGLRIHDNPALDYACRGSSHIFPVFVLDPRYLHPDPSAFSLGSARAGLNRIRFLLDCLLDLDSSLRNLGSRLLVLRGHPEPASVICRILKDWNIRKVCYEFDTEPYGQARDRQVTDFARQLGIEVFSPVSHTLFDPAENGGRPPLTYQSFVALAGKPPDPLAKTYSELPPVGNVGKVELLNIPTIEELGYRDIEQEEFSPFGGGESEALRRLNEVLKDKEWVANFEKPKGDPSAFWKPATTVLSPYLKFGCLSSRYFYHCLHSVYLTVGKHTSPPVSLVGQLLWREFFYTVAFGTPNFDQMRGNKICKQIPWKDDDKLLVAWREGRTGYPWIDAIMIQLKKWGWMHHLARHSVACFLTRGDLYHRIYSPISFGRKYDPDGKYIRHFLPVLKDMPNEYIYEPWTAPLSIQKKANCIIGKDYPRPVVVHDRASKECRKKMGEAYAKVGSAEEEDDTAASESTTMQKRKRRT
ncbi:FAD binding domain of DNA photolyase [Musa troglodytarum]|uniref:FAD binding domain of DNA photolyase n=1 Tax=Musa troglodytarum TaxID=320322 RepID=A0A9E7HVS0_9LILI|nr:FAD binding domain of DNA photolyase [Musa troglodytarum]